MPFRLWLRRLKMLILYSQRFHRTKVLSSEKLGNGPFSDPTLHRTRAAVLHLAPPPRKNSRPFTATFLTCQYSGLREEGRVAIDGLCAESVHVSGPLGLPLPLQLLLQLPLLLLDGLQLVPHVLHLLQRHLRRDHQVTLVVIGVISVVVVVVFVVGRRRLWGAAEVR